MNPRFSQLLQILKQLMIQVQAEDGDKIWLNEFKIVLAKFEQTEGAAASEGGLLFPKNETLSNALRMIEEVQRTGALFIKGKEMGQEGQMEFLQGKIISASAGRVRGHKAIYRMFLWNDVRYLFSRRDPSQSVVEEPIAESLGLICQQGEEYRTRLQAIQQKLPPPTLRLELEPKSLENGLRLGHEDFMVLSDTIAFNTISAIMDYSTMPDVVIYESLIRLRKQNVIRIAA